MSDSLENTTQKVYDTLLAALKTLGYEYEEERRYLVAFALTGNDIPMNFRMALDEEKKTVILYSLLPLTFAEKDREIGAIAVSAVNYRLADGSFDFDISNGAVCFRMTANYRDSEIGIALLEYMICCSAMTVDRYNDKLLMISRGLITEDEFNIEIGFTD